MHGLKIEYCNNMNTPPLCSIIAPFYNSERFIEQAYSSIINQNYKNIEIIFINDGSTDKSLKILENLIQNTKIKIQVVSQINQGAYAARNAGLNLTSGKYISFYDIDDIWHAHHLESCISSLEQNPDVDLVYCNCEIRDFFSQEILQKSAFNLNNQNNKFLSLKHENRSNLKVMKDPKTASMQILHGLYLGLQFTVFRSEVFDNYRFDTEFKNEAEDQTSAIKLLKKNYCFSYLIDIHGIYYLHDQNSSAANKTASRDKLIQVRLALISGYQKLFPILNYSERFQLRYRLSQEYFWDLGYNLGFKNKDYNFAMKYYFKAIKLWPFSLRFYKSLISLFILKIYSICRK